MLGVEEVEMNVDQVELEDQVGVELVEVEHQEEQMQDQEQLTQVVEVVEVKTVLGIDILVPAVQESLS